MSLKAYLYVYYLCVCGTMDANEGAELCPGGSIYMGDSREREFEFVGVRSQERLGECAL